MTIYFIVIFQWSINTKNFFVLLYRINKNFILRHKDMTIIRQRYSWTKSKYIPIDRTFQEWFVVFFLRKMISINFSKWIKCIFSSSWNKRLFLLIIENSYKEIIGNMIFSVIVPTQYFFKSLHEIWMIIVPFKIRCFPMWS